MILATPTIMILVVMTTTSYCYYCCYYDQDQNHSVQLQQFLAVLLTAKEDTIEAT
jgi:hypothetical protein